MNKTTGIIILGLIFFGQFNTFGQISISDIIAIGDNIKQLNQELEALSEQTKICQEKNETIHDEVSYWQSQYVNDSLEDINYFYVKDVISEENESLQLSNDSLLTYTIDTINIIAYPDSLANYFKNLSVIKSQKVSQIETLKSKLRNCKKSNINTLKELESIRDNKILNTRKDIKIPRFKFIDLLVYDNYMMDENPRRHLVDMGESFTFNEIIDFYNPKTKADSISVFNYLREKNRYLIGIQKTADLRQIKGNREFKKNGKKQLLVWIPNYAAILFRPVQEYPDYFDPVNEEWYLNTTSHAEDGYFRVKKITPIIKTKNTTPSNHDNKNRSEDNPDTIGLPLPKSNSNNSNQKKND